MESKFNKKMEMPKQKIEKVGCEIEIRNTKAGKKIKFSGKCSKEELRAFASDNGVEGIEE